MNRTSVDRGALQMAINVLERAGKFEVAQELKTDQRKLTEEEQLKMFLDHFADYNFMRFINDPVRGPVFENTFVHGAWVGFKAAFR